ncbi:unnamed protein product, partial [Symbiodinium pilosum]
ATGEQRGSSNSFRIEVYAAATGTLVTTVNMQAADTVEKLVHKICAEVGQCPEETELIYKTERLDQRHCLCNVGLIADAEVQIVKVPLPLKNAQDVFRYFDNSMRHVEHRPILNFMGDQERIMPGDWIARLWMAESPPRTATL